MTAYTVGFSVSSDGKKEVFIETDDLQSLSDADWFREFLDLRVTKQSAADTMRQTELMLQLQNMQQENLALRQMVMEQRQQARPPASAVAPSQQASARPADELIKNIAQPPTPPQPRRLPTSYLELTPEQMTPDIYNSLNSEQQAQWLKKYNLM